MDQLSFSNVIEPWMDWEETERIIIFGFEIGGTLDASISVVGVICSFSGLGNGTVIGVDSN